MAYWLRGQQDFTIEDYCKQVIHDQKCEKQKYLKLNKQDVLIKDKDQNYRIVSKNYYLYHLRDDELDTEEELIDEDDWEDEKRIIAQCCSKPQGPP